MSETGTSRGELREAAEVPHGQDIRMASPTESWFERGSAAYVRVSLAFFLAGFATFSLIYCVQPLLPVLAEAFEVGPAEAALALSLTTGFLALGIACAGALSQALGRRGLMFASICGAALMNIAAALAPDWPLMLAARALEGLILGGVPAVAMAYLGEEIHPRGLGFTMGLYIGGTALGGMLGRVGTGLLAEATSWSSALCALGALDLVAATGFFLLLPPSRHFVRRPGFDIAFHLAAWGHHLRDGGLAALFLIGGLAMGAFVTIYNYAGFRVLAPPYELNPAHVSLIFTAYLFGVLASWAAGYFADRAGRGPVLIAGIAIAIAGVTLTMLAPLAVVIGGIVVLTIGFFVAHAVASGAVAALAATTKGHAASLYLLSYYIGSSIMGAAGGWFWDRWGWTAVVAFALALLGVALGAGLYVKPRLHG